MPSCRAGFWRSLETAALEALRAGRAGESGYSRRAVHLLIIPALGPVSAWDVRRTPVGRAYVVRLTWCRELDSALASRLDEYAGAHPASSPTIQTSHWELDSRLLDDLLANLSARCGSALPAAADAGGDGTGYELTLCVGGGARNYRWRGRPPGLWRPLASFAAGLLTIVQQDPHLSLAS